MQITQTFKLSVVDVDMFGFNAKLYKNIETGVWTANFTQPLIAGSMDTIYAYEQFLSYVVWYLQELNK